MADQITLTWRTYFNSTFSIANNVSENRSETNVALFQQQLLQIEFVVSFSSL